MAAETEGVQQLMVMRKEDAPEQQECRSGLDQERQGPPFIKEEPEEEDLDHQFFVIPVQVKSEDDEATSSWTQHTEIEADGDKCGGAKPASSLDTPLLPDQQGSPGSDTDDSEDWRETTDAQSGSKSVENPKVDASEKNDEDESLICSGCGRKCHSRGGLTRHMKCCSQGKSRPFGCSQCGKCYKRRTHLKDHMKSHSEEKAFVCSLCGKCFRQRQSLSCHMKLHTGEKPYSCSYCDKCFSRNYDLQCHLGVHTGEKKFSCSQCDKCYTRKRYLACHMRSHTGEKPFSCSQCGKSFTVAYLLKCHTLIHTGEKPYGCSECSKCFTDKSNLRTHLKLHHGKQPSD